MAARAATVDDVRARLGPAFADPPITDAVIELYLEDAACFVSSAFGACQSQAHAYAAAHCVASSPEAAGIPVPQGMGPLVAGEANGPASRSSSVPAPPAGAGPWYMTGWGRMFIEYRLTRWGCGSAVLARTSRSVRRAC